MIQQSVRGGRKTPVSRRSRATATKDWKAASETVLFSFSDRPVQRALGLWREQYH